MRLPVRLALTLVGFAIVASGAAAQEPTTTTPEMHPWGRFKPGAWRRIQVVTETFDEQGRVANTSTSFSTTRLQRGKRLNLIALAVEVVVDMSGKQIETPASVIEQGFYGQSPDDKVTVNPVGAEEIQVAGKRVQCRVELVETEGPAGRTITKTWFSASVAPFILKRESKTLDVQGQQTVNETHVEVEAICASSDLFPNLASLSRVKVVTRHSKGKTETTVLTSPEIPGGVVSHVANEFDGEGHLTRRSTLTLVNYGLTPKDDDDGIFRRMRNRRGNRRA